MNTVTLKTIKIFESEDQLRQIFVDQSIRVLRIGDQKVCITQKNESYFAFEALCPHQRHPLSEATINDFGEVICPLHFYRFNLTTGTEANRLCKDLKTYQVDLRPDGIFLKLH